ncbi:hypothetical protein HYW17_03105 [Candidatus Uhrbacteria bacterium]|nr:hypothetical protein [Candidatus Uhrbacteria bacterium]
MSSADLGPRSEALARIAIETQKRNEIQQRGWTVVNVEVDFFDWERGYNKGVPESLIDKKSIVLSSSGRVLFYDEKLVDIRRDVIEKKRKGDLEQQGWKLVGPILAGTDNEGIYVKDKER